MKSFPNIACRELVSEALGAPLERVPSAQVMAAWEESGDLPYGVSLEKYDDDTWDCFAVAGFLVEAAVSYDDLDRKWALRACQMVCVSGVSYLKEIDYGYDQAEEARRARAGA